MHITEFDARYRTELPLKGGANTRAMYTRSCSPMHEPRHYSRALQRVKLGDALEILQDRIPPLRISMINVPSSTVYLKQHCSKTQAIYTNFMTPSSQVLVQNQFMQESPIN